MRAENFIYDQEGKKESEISRKDEMFFSHTGLITIAGGKLTGYRKMAEKVVTEVAKRLGRYEQCMTDKIVLSGGNVGGSEKFNEFVTEQTSIGISIGLKPLEAEQLAKRYGSNVGKVFEIAKAEEGNVKKYGLPLGIYASLVYGIQEEMVQTPTDFLLRRTSILLYNKEEGLLHRKAVFAYLQHHYLWNEEILDRINNLENSVFI